VRLIVHRQRVAAPPADRVHFARHIEVLEPDQPERRFVAALRVYRHAVDTGRAGCMVCDQEAERSRGRCRCPARRSFPSPRWSDVELAQLFTAPLDEVAQHPRDVAADV
jgi:hypothetical protein